MRKLFWSMILTLGATGLSAPAVLAADSDQCGGNLIDYVPVNRGGQKVAQLELYYNPQNGNNCAMMLHGGPSWGVLLDTGVGMAKAPNRSAPFQPADFQRGNYRYWAGPIRTAGRGQCVYADGGMDWGGGPRIYVRTNIFCK